MQRVISIALVRLLVATLAGSGILAQEDPGWPQERSTDGGTMIIHQPQVDKWDDFLHLEARVAVVVTPTGWDEPVLGALHIKAETQTDHESRTVLIYNREIVDARYPALDSAKSADVSALILSMIKGNSQLYSLDRILAYLERSESTVRSTAVSYDPPIIFASTEPAVLLQFDGNPLFGSIEDCELKFAVNTNWDMILDPSDSTYFILNDSVWLSAKSFKGPYAKVKGLPKEFKNIPDDSAYAEIRKHSRGDMKEPTSIPRVFVATEPAELILTEGKVELKDIENTKIQYVANTDVDLFRHTETKLFYFLVSGRWFMSETLEGPWSSVGEKLPKDFALVPEDHPKGHVLASVPGTPQADEAVLQAQIPQQASVNPDSVTLEVSYEGEPEFAPIETTELKYAVNTSYTVIMTGSSYYACHNAIWFVAGSANGPWIVCTKVPAAIYTIPPAAPVHHVTYVHVYETSPTVVVFGYTSGYFGVYVSSGCVVFGTGFYYHPYVHWGHYPYPIYYPHPYSYGVAAYYNPYRGTYVRGAAVYGPHGGYGRAAAYNPHTGTYARGVAAWGPHGGTTVARAYNPYTGGRAATKQSGNAYSHWGRSAVSRGDKWAQTGHYSDSRGTVAGFRTSEGGKGVIVDRGSQEKLVAKNRNDDLYVGKDGEVYRRSEEGWSKYGEGGWDPVENGDREQRQSDRSKESGEVMRTQDQTKKTDKSRDKNKSSEYKSSTRTQDLDKNAKARSRGNKNVSDYKSSRSKQRSGGRSRGRRR